MRNIQERRIVNKFLMMLQMIRQGQSHRVAHMMRRRWWSKEKTNILRRDMTIPLETPKAKLNLSIRKFHNDDIPKLLDFDSPAINEQDRSDIVRRRFWLKENLQTCYAAATEDGMPCFMIWLMSPDQNDKIQTFFGGDCLSLKDDEMLMEGAYVHPDVRNAGITAYVVKLLPELFADKQTRWIVTYIDPANVPAQRAAAKVGFQPFMEIEYTWRFFHKRTRCRELTVP